MYIKIDNNLHVGAPVSYLTFAEVAGTTSIRVQNTTGLTTSWAIQLGKTGADKTEVVIGTVAAFGSVTCPALAFDHPADTPVSFIKYNQVVFERSTDGTAGTASPMTNGTIGYQADSPFTQFDDTSGLSTYGYRTYFRNSALSVNSIESDWITQAGNQFYSLAAIRERTKAKLWDSSFIKDDRIVDDWTNEWKDKLTNIAINSNEDYALGTVDVAFGTDGLGTVTTGDFKQARRVWVNYGVGFFQSVKMNINDFDPNQDFSTTLPHHAWQGNDVFQVKPDGQAGTARIHYYALGTPMSNDTDELPRYMRGYTDTFVDYNLLQAQYKDGKIGFTEKKKIEDSMLGQFATELAPRDKSSQTLVDILDPLTGGY